MASEPSPAKTNGNVRSASVESTHGPGITVIVPALLAWFVRHARVLPWRQTLDPYGIWVSEIMLQQTQVKTVIPYWLRWMEEFPDVSALAAARPERVLKLWEGLGYYTRARNLQKAAQFVVEKHRGSFPKDHAEVLALPGIGRYTAGAICSIARNAPTPILDGNIVRVLTRLWAIDRNPREPETNRRLWMLAEDLVRQPASCRLPPARRLPFVMSGPCSALNQSLMELGALICTPKLPRCGECPIQSECRAFVQNRVAELPRTDARRKATPRDFVAFAIERKGQWLLRQRPAGTFNAHLWEFPSFEAGHGTVTPGNLFRRQFGVVPHDLKPLKIIRHSIMHFRMTVRPFRTQWRGSSKTGNEFVWRNAAEVEALALTSAHRKLWRQLENYA
jgi:A/G-specific adenine glycosylase